METKDILTAIFGLIGAIIGGLFALRAAQMAHRNELALKRRERTQQIDGILSAIKYELTVLGEIYGQEAGRFLTLVPDGQPLDMHFSLTKDYFIVYPNNTSTIGQIEDEDLCKSIVFTYNKANFLIEAFVINNQYLLQKKELHAGPADIPFNAEQLAAINALHQLRISHVATIKKANADLKTETGNLLRKIDEYRRKHPIS